MPPQKVSYCNIDIACNINNSHKTQHKENVYKVYQYYLLKENWWLILIAYNRRSAENLLLTLIINTIWMSDISYIASWIFDVELH